MCCGKFSCEGVYWWGELIVGLCFVYLYEGSL